jgi:hypothetical protein
MPGHGVVDADHTILRHGGDQTQGNLFHEHCFSERLVVDPAYQNLGGARMTGPLTLDNIYRIIETLGLRPL